MEYKIMKNGLTLWFLVFSSLFLCALANASEPELEISGHLVKSYCSENFGLVSFRFENESVDWITLSQLEIDFGSEVINKNIGIVTGRALSSWQEGIANKIESDRFIQNLIIGTAAFIGGAMSVSSNEKSEKIGNTLALSSLGVMAVNTMSKKLESINSSDIFPRNHIYHGNVLVAPGLSADRWVLLYSRNKGEVPFIKNISLQYFNSKTGKKAKKKIDLRKYNPTKCSWQKSIAPPKKDKF
jgi:hypothetical protein